MNLANNSRNNILFINFNQDFTCLSIGTVEGYRVFNSQPKFVEVFSQQTVSIGICEMLFTSSLVAIVGAGDSTNLNPRKLHIVNTKNNSIICELSFVTPILAVKLNKKRMVVVLETKIHIYDISTMKILHTVETKPNPKGICAFSPSEENCYLAFPSSNDRGQIILFDGLTLQTVNIINAHKSPLSKLTFNQSGTMIASASNKGTVIRVFSVQEPTRFYQFRRGTYPAAVHSISFSVDSSFLCVSSDTGTVHIFKTDQTSLSLSNQSQQKTGGISSYLPEALTDMWDTIPIRSFATLKLPLGVESLCTINQNNTVVMVVTGEGKFLEFHMDPKVGGELKLSHETMIIKNVKNDEGSLS